MTPCFAELTLNDLNIPEHSKYYNSLPSAGNADDALKSVFNFSDFLEKAEEVVSSYGFEKHTGLRLIHRHFDLNPSQVMVEEFQEVNGNPSLVTSALSVDEARQKSAVPSGWCFNSSPMKIFEFSTDEAVRTGFRDIQTTPEFLEQMEVVIKNYNLENLMSVSLLGKDSLLAGEGQIYEERTYDSQSVVQLVDESLRSAESIRTSWSFKGPREVACIKYQTCVEDVNSEVGHRAVRGHK